jgi:hypothetical protein
VPSQSKRTPWIFPFGEERMFGGVRLAESERVRVERSNDATVHALRLYQALMVEVLRLPSSGSLRMTDS